MSRETQGKLFIISKEQLGVAL